MQAAEAGRGVVVPDAHRLACVGAGQQGLQVFLAGLPVRLHVGIRSGCVAVRGEAEPCPNDLFACFTHQVARDGAFVQVAQQGYHVVRFIVHRDGLGTAAGLLLLGAAFIKRCGQGAVDGKGGLLQRGIQRFIR